VPKLGGQHFELQIAGTTYDSPTTAHLALFTFR
jgi:hypothetical protein